MEIGVLRQKNKKYALRILGNCGLFNTIELKNITKISDLYGNSTITMTSRGTIEINEISEENIEKAYSEAKKLNLNLSGTGSIVRSVIACKGSQCLHGLFDVHKIASSIEEKFLGISVPKKFKIGVFGCQNSLGKAKSQDLAFIPSTTDKGKFSIYIGGMMGKTPILGIKLEQTVYENEVLKTVEIILNFYKKYGKDKERFRQTLDRLNPDLEKGINQTLKKTFK